MSYVITKNLNMKLPISFGMVKNQAETHVLCIRRGVTGKMAHLCITKVYPKVPGQCSEGVSKSPRTMLLTRKSLAVHEFPARVCCGGAL